MAVSLHEILQPQVILDVVSRIRAGTGRLSNWMGFQPTKFDEKTVSLSGPMTVQGDTRYAMFRIFDVTRTIAHGRAPGTGPGTIPANPIGQQPVACARFHDKLPLSFEELGNLSPVIGPNSQVDQGGQDYISRQITHIARRFNNLVELLTSGFMQDNLWFQYQGDNIVPLIGQPLTGGFSFQIPFQVPAGNKNQLNMLGGGNILTLGWQNIAAQIIKNLIVIKAAFTQLHNHPLTDIWLNSLEWYNVIVNTEVRNTAGTAATPFAEYDRIAEKGPDGQPTGDNACQMVLKGDPTINWHTTDEVLVTNSDVDPSYASAPSTATIQKVIPDKMAYFCTKPSPDWARMYLGGEHVVENPGMNAVLRRGYYFWREYTTQPSGMDLIGLLNCVPLLYVPKILCPATVEF